MYNLSRFVFISFLFVNTILINSCNRDINEPKGEVAIYLLDNFNTVGESFKIDEASAITEKEPFFKYSDLLSYSKKDHSFELSNDAVNLFKNTHSSLFGKGFAVKANDEILYTGYFWSGTSSGICDWVIIDLIAMPENRIKVQIGYPNEGVAQGVEDRRNSKILLDIFDRDGKLKD